MIEFSVHEEYLPVQELIIHIPNQQVVYFKPNMTEERIQAKMDRSRSTLMAFFDYNAEHLDGRHLLYQEFPEHYVFDQKIKAWHIRKKGKSIGRMYYCNPLVGKKFYLQLLLTVVRGPQSFEHLCTIDGVVNNTFRKAAIAMGLIHDDQEWIDTFTEAITFASGESLQKLLVTVLVHGGLADAVVIWNQF